LVGDLLIKLLQSDPALRITSSEALCHPWCRIGEFDECGSIAGIIDGRNVTGLTQSPAVNDIYQTSIISNLNSISSFPSVPHVSRKLFSDRRSPSPKLQCLDTTRSFGNNTHRPFLIDDSTLMDGVDKRKTTIDPRTSSYNDPIVRKEAEEKKLFQEVGCDITRHESNSWNR
jgi:serine/threonine protein kinase